MSSKSPHIRSKGKNSKEEVFKAIASSSAGFASFSPVKNKKSNRAAKDLI